VVVLRTMLKAVDLLVGLTSLTKIKDRLKFHEEHENRAVSREKERQEKESGENCVANSFQVCNIQ